MDLNELFALMAAPIYAARMRSALSTVQEWPQHLPWWMERRNEAMQASVTEARMIWEIAQAQARDA